MHEQRDDFSIFTHQHHYVKELQTIDLSIYKGKPPQTQLDEHHSSLYSSLVGALAWLLQVYVEVAVYVHALQRHLKQPLLEHAARANRIVLWARKNKSGILFSFMPPPYRLLCVTDAAFRKEEPDGLAVKGALIMICGGPVCKLGGKINFLEQISSKQRRVARSTFASETLALVDGIELSRLINYALTEVMIGTQSPTQLQALDDTNKLPLKLHVVIDALSVFSALIPPDIKPPSESSMLIQLLIVKELLLQGRIILHWCDTRDMIADALTK
eukprot:5385281-Karenia_brevis.AAC.1